MEQRAWERTVGGLVVGIRGPCFGVNRMLRWHVMEQVGDHKDCYYYKKNAEPKWRCSHLMPADACSGHQGINTTIPLKSDPSRE